MKKFLLSLIMSVIVPMATASLTDGLVAHYTFENMVGDVVEDITGNGYNGTAHGNVHSVSGERYGDAAIFDGDGDYIVTNNFTERWNQWCISFFIKPTDISSTSFVVGRENYGIDHDVEVQIRDNGYIYIENDQSMNLMSQNQIVAGEWIHIAVNYDGSAKQIYIGKDLDISQDDNNAYIDVIAPLRIGYHPNTAQPIYFSGLIDNIRVYNRALTPEEIASIPEPATLSLLALGGLLLRKRK